MDSDSAKNEYFIVAIKWEGCHTEEQGEFLMTKAKLQQFASEWRMAYRVILNFVNTVKRRK